MSRVTPRTHRLLEKLFSPQQQTLLMTRLETECTPERLGCKGWTPEQMERLWFAVLKLSFEQPERTDQAFQLAKADWRDLLMAAGFGMDLNAHNKLVGETCHLTWRWCGRAADRRH